MLRTLLSIVLLCFAAQLSAQVRTFSGPAGSKDFGANVTILNNGNYVITDPEYDNGRQTNAGAVYLYDGKTHALISRLTGSNVGDRVGSYGVVPLTNGNFVVVSPSWANDNGAVTWGDGVTGVSGNVSSLNSLVGGASRSAIGEGGVTALPNGNYVVCSPKWTDGIIFWLGAVTWCDGATGRKGTVSAANSIIGSFSNDYVGLGGVKVLNNGNYVIVSHEWNAKSGAVTWCSGTSATTGAVSASNSLVGGPGSYVGDSGVVILPGGNYVVRSCQWNNGNQRLAGAVTWGSGTAGVTGLVSASNSLIGGTAFDRIGVDGITVLPNGNFVVNSSWCSGSSWLEAGAVTWGSGTTGVSGLVSSTNSLVGNQHYSRVGIGGITLLSNGNYVVNSYLWSSASRAKVGAVTWGDGTSGVSGTVSAANSLVGDSALSHVGQGGVTALTNGNYVVSSPDWQNDSQARAGAVTWCDGATGRRGSITFTNSLVGDSMAHRIGSGGVAALANGNYVVCSPGWSAGDSSWEYLYGAVTWADGSTGRSGWVTMGNSLTGKIAYAGVGYRVTALRNGHYVVSSPYWSDTVRRQVGATTWCDGTKVTSDYVSSRNSLIGSQTGDLIGNGGIVPLADGNYVVSSPAWNRGAIREAGAATWCDGTRITSGTVDITNSLVGSSTDDRIGMDFLTPTIIPLAHGGYAVASSGWNNGAAVDAGAITWGKPGSGVTGSISAANSLVGEQTHDYIGRFVIMPLTHGDCIVFSPFWANGSMEWARAITWVGAGGIAGVINACNSVTGNVAHSRINFAATSLYDSVRNRLIVGKPAENKYSIFTPGTNALVAATRSVSATVAGTSQVHFVDSGCELLVTLRPSGTSKVAGAVKATTFLEPTAPNLHGQAYLRRYYEITPASNPNTATARLTLYYTQDDFDDYNQNNGAAPDMPASPSDAAGIAAVRFTQQHGSSASGLPGTFTGWTGSGPSSVLIDPDDADIVWSATENRWEISFDINGFSGFFGHAGDKLDVAAAGPANMGLSLSPVPASDAVQLDCRDERLIGTTAGITDLQGRELGRVIVSRRTPIDVSAWSSGIYMLKLTNGAVLRIVKQ